MGTLEIIDKDIAYMDTMVMGGRGRKKLRHNLMGLGERLNVESKEVRRLMYHSRLLSPWHNQTPYR